jgi:hypothetical protein
MVAYVKFSYKDIEMYIHKRLNELNMCFLKGYIIILNLLIRNNIWDFFYLQNCKR